jgi:predicted TIM-barrel fold metal-dependent hydrolase
MIIDCHNHITKPYNDLELYQPPERTVSEMNRAGVDKAVVFPFPELTGSISENNDYIFEAIKKYPDRLIGFCHINPWQRDQALEELDRCFNKLKLKGLKLHPSINHFPINAHSLTDQIFEKCAKYRVPIISHGQGDSPFCTPAQFGDMADTFPDVQLIMAHMGYWQNTEDAIFQIKKHDNLFADTTVVANLDLIRKAVEIAGEKLLFGTDTPGNSMKLEIMKIKIAISSRKKRELIFCKNIMHILQL